MNTQAKYKFACFEEFSNIIALLLSNWIAIN